MDVKQLTALVAVADAGSVTRAAELLHLVQPAVTRQIHTLEQELGVPLFERSRAGMELTESGRLMLERARRCCPNSSVPGPRSDRIQGCCKGS